MEFWEPPYTEGMRNRLRPDAIDTRFVFWVYAALAGLAGLALIIWGPMWFDANRADAALIRLLGSILIAVGCFAFAFATVEDPASRRRGLLWFAVGHTVIFCVLSVQHTAIWGPRVAVWAAGLVLAASYVFLYFWWTAAGDHLRPPLTLTSLFAAGTVSPAERLRSEYERQIRQAASQEERNRLARDLHDSIKQQIFVIQTATATAQVRFDTDPAGARQALEQVRNSAREAATEMEVMLDQLRAGPLENTGLVELLKKQCEALGFRTGARVELKVGKLPPSEVLAPGAQQAIFRVAQEALANVGRHARAKNVLVAFDSFPGRVELRIQDDGAGFDPNQSPSGMGVANMRARADEFGGTLELESRPRGGTSVVFSIPYTVYTAREYRRQALVWGTLLLILILLFPFGNMSPILFVAVALLAAIALTRETVAWLRTRKQGEASS